MARPSVKEERAEAILAAFERVVARFGVEGATLERISQESGLHRSLLRHHVGNREALIERLIERCIGSEQEDLCELKASTENMVCEDAENSIMAYLFAEMPEQEQVKMKVAMALLAAVEGYPNIKPRLIQWNNDFVSALQSILQSIYPKADSRQCVAVAWGLASLSLSTLSIASLGRGVVDRQSSTQAAVILLESLKL